MKPAGRMILVGALTCAICAAATGTASAKVYSSGTIDKRIPDLGRAVSTIKVKKDVPITDINVNVRITHGFQEDLLVGLFGHGEFTELVSQSDASGKSMGTGPKSCGGTFTTFDDEAVPTIPGSSAPYAGHFRPAGELNSAYEGDSAAARWKLYIFDLNASDKGHLHCWQLDIQT